MSILGRVLLWLAGLVLRKLFELTTPYGSLLLQQTWEPGPNDVSVRVWQCNLRAPATPGKPGYAWVAKAPSITDAILGALYQARENPIEPIVGAPHAPKLGGAEFDPE